MRMDDEFRRHPRSLSEEVRRSLQGEDLQPKGSSVLKMKFFITAAPMEYIDFELRSLGRAGDSFIAFRAFHRPAFPRPAALRVMPPVLEAEG